MAPPLPPESGDGAGHPLVVLDAGRAAGAYPGCAWQTDARTTDKRYCNQFSPILPNKSPWSADAKLVSSYSCTPSLAHNNLLTSSHDTTRPLSLSPAISKSPDRPPFSSNAAVAPPAPRSCLGPYFQGTAMPSATSEEGGEEVIISPMVFIKSAVGGHSSTEVRTD